MIITISQQKKHKQCHRLSPQIFAARNEVVSGNRRQKIDCCQKLLPPYLLFFFIVLLNLQSRPKTAILVVGIAFARQNLKFVDEILSWLLVYGYLEVKVVLKNIIAILRLAIGSSVGSKVGIANPESGDVGLAGGC
ncbi:hypothetical protein Tco_0685581 [Tanacetum coccineum]